ncbi:hypothetical protein GWE18_00475 [Bradyrhizobium sp. CSA112]|uniref:hypothetical protein n=1 Tax=Bradyrhizobium sp. CSA112 TaxID=2699170 RepID=UPI0023B0412E|nr:hypothetical protein [Bradyrhizobium sp. CSA112]MDE5451351.1 hypothetical protein [Bradyrhizobium sp. CSA112]
MTVWIYQRGDEIKVFATAEAAQKWFDENDPEGVAFEHEVIGSSAAQAGSRERARGFLPLIAASAASCGRPARLKAAAFPSRGR